MAIEPTINPAPEDIGTGSGMGGANIETPQTPDFTGGAEVLQDGQGGAIVQALQQAMAYYHRVQKNLSVIARTELSY